MRDDDVRRETHTGRDRCWPCTTVNLGLVGLVALWLYRRDRRVVSLLVAAVGAAAVAVRGYVVPYTPQFAPRLVTALPTDLFAKPTRERPTSDSVTGTELDGERVLNDLAAAGAITADGEQIVPTAAVDDTWHREMDRLSNRSQTDLAEEVAATVPDLPGASPYEDDEGSWLVVDGGLVARPVVVGELAAYLALDGTVADSQLRLAGARAFRLFLDSCPDCGAALAESSEVSCCGGYTDPQTTPETVLVCPTCEQRLVTLPA